MKKTFTEKHHGEIIELAVRRRNISITELSKRLSVSRRSVYNWFDKEFLPNNIIRRIAQALKYDFVDEFPEALATEKDINDKGSLSEADSFVYTDSVSFWKNKYLNLLENHTSMLSRQ